MINFTKTAAVIGLVAGSSLGLAAIPAQAFSFGNDGIQFDKDTLVDFGFISSQGLFKSTLSVFDGTTSTVLFAETKAFDTSLTDFKGSCPKTVSSPSGNCENSFLFKSGVNYSLLLDSTPNGKVYSTTSLNNPATLQAIFTETGANSYLIAFDDRGNRNDVDFNDFKVTAEFKSVPEPTALAGLGLVAGTIALSSRRKKNQA
ncbi:MAG TPA: hypothetical protein DEG17_13330 [Cyanobacteria bacterium UBA11149]|nr:hypothetical protein [Cyanobacteria bacterium UBA11367]HBE59271.1 hypothetical protein [Cyanobacteria bacterium UBA11366]HBR77024.1 hypothetical protein [Cyanobacteria bacterium UBA11159]HBS70674.1 hypothetical protein [Cyanobacteria bacterium UBA11153]HBW89823.1 hypothetical protein [Cyanobacteria bacterium UBA11149]HCA95410.1 hypothetical protein [Cyanobacteria bacterium UBA9226]